VLGSGNGEETDRGAMDSVVIMSALEGTGNQPTGSVWMLYF
jgi:hypothetical protein